jgi:hypothetical protein
VMLQYVQSHQDDTQASPSLIDDESGMLLLPHIRHMTRKTAPTCEQYQ